MPQPTADDQAVALARALQDFFPAQFPPKTSTPFSLAPAGVVVTAAAGSGTVFDLTSFFGSGSGAVPAGRTVIITAFGVSSGATTLLWTFLVNGVPRWPVVSFVGQYGSIAAPAFLPGPGLALKAGDVFTVSLKNNAGVDVTAFTRVDGFVVYAS